MQLIENKFHKFIINQFTTNDLNKVPEDFGGNRIFSDPIYGVSRGDDPIFDKYKKLVFLINKI